MDHGRFSAFLVEAKLKALKEMPLGLEWCYTSCSQSAWAGRGMVGRDRVLECLGKTLKKQCCLGTLKPQRSRSLGMIKGRGREL